MMSTMSIDVVRFARLTNPRKVMDLVEFVDTLATMGISVDAEVTVTKTSGHQLDGDTTELTVSW